MGFLIGLGVFIIILVATFIIGGIIFLCVYLTLAEDAGKDHEDCCRGGVIAACIIAVVILAAILAKNFASYVFTPEYFGLEQVPAEEVEDGE